MMKRLIAAVLAAAIFISPGAAPAAYADTAAVPITAEITATPVDFEITESVTMSYSGSGNDLTISDIVITNNKAEDMNLVVDNIAVNPIMGWSVVSAGTDFTNKLNKKEFSIATGTHDFSAGSYTEAGTIEEGKTLTLSFEGKVGSFSSKVSEKAANIVVTISLEEAVKIVSWASGSDEDIVAMVVATDEGKIKLTDYWNVGDERTVSLAESSLSTYNISHAAQTVTFVLMNEGGVTLANGKECSFVVGQKNALLEQGSMNYGTRNNPSLPTGGWAGSERRTWCNSSYYNAIPISIRPIFKQFICKAAGAAGSNYALSNSTDYFALPAEFEVFGVRESATTAEAASLVQFEWYKNAANQIKYLGNGGTKTTWWFRSPDNFNGSYFCANKYMSGYNYSNSWQSLGISPYGCI